MCSRWTGCGAANLRQQAGRVAQAQEAGPGGGPGQTLHQVVHGYVGGGAGQDPGAAPNLLHHRLHHRRGLACGPRTLQTSAGEMATVHGRTHRHCVNERDSLRPQKGALHTRKGTACFERSIKELQWGIMDRPAPLIMHMLALVAPLLGRCNTHAESSDVASCGSNAALQCPDPLHGTQ